MCGCVILCVFLYKRKVVEEKIDWMCQYEVLCVGKWSLEREREQVRVGVMQINMRLERNGGD